MLDEIIGPTDPCHGGVDPQVFEGLQYCAAETAHKHVILQRTYHLADASVFLNHVTVNWLAEPRR